MDPEAGNEGIAFMRTTFTVRDTTWGLVSAIPITSLSHSSLVPQVIISHLARQALLFGGLLPPEQVESLHQEIVSTLGSLEE